jgi:1-acyl-sn-glycerol-3-phosphate acyltransferase
VIRALLRILRALAHVLHGAYIALTRYRRLSAAEQDAELVRWAARLMAILGVRVEVEGALPGGGVVLVANHVSWLDIHLLHALMPCRFVSKAEVRGWPIIGPLAELVGTLFLERTRKADALRVNGLIAQHLAQGQILAIFPEGTTSDGTGLLPFYPFLFQPAAEAGCPVVPCVIRYQNLDGGPCPDAAYYGDMSLLQSLWRITRLPGLVARLTFLPPQQGGDRRVLAKGCEGVIREALAR